MIYHVRRAQPPVALDAGWEQGPWEDTRPDELAHHMGERPAHFPRTCFKILYDDDAVYIMFRVEDRYVRAIASEHQGQVWKDSCVEFFFRPSDAEGSGYFNLEMNCGGTMLFHHQRRPWQNAVSVSPEDVRRIETHCSLPRIVEPEMTEPLTWTVAYRLPFDIVARYCPSAKRPASGVSWRANLYKCAEHNSHPHWLTWAPVDHPRPNFHLPEYFGTIQFL